MNTFQLTNVIPERMIFDSRGITVLSIFKSLTDLLYVTIASNTLLKSNELTELRARSFSKVQSLCGICRCAAIGKGSG